MATKSKANSEVTALRTRLSDLSDKITNLENDLNLTKKMIQEDIKKVLNITRDLRGR